MSDTLGPLDHHIEDDVEAPAYAVVPISEDPMMRIVFNAVTKAELGRPAQSSDEVVIMYELATEGYRDTIKDALVGFGELNAGWHNDDEVTTELFEVVKTAVEEVAD